MRKRLVVATRSPDKLREIREILSEFGVEAVGLVEIGCEEQPEESGLEPYDSFEENAVSKGRYFAGRTGETVLADDSGLSVDALNGRPGVYSKRFSDRTDLRGAALDAANNRRLLEELQGVAPQDRSASYVCSIALVTAAGDERVFSGRCDGRILEEEKGTGGFGYDPLFLVPEEGKTFAELPAERKNEISHRSRAVRSAGRALAGLDPLD